MCICVYSNKILYPILPTALYLTLFTESFQWDLGVLSISRVHGICWDKTLSKASLKGFEYLQKKKRGGRDANIFEVFFFFSFLAVFATENSRARSCFSDLAQRRPVCTYTVSENVPAPCFLGKDSLCGCGLFGVGGGSADIKGRDEVKSKQTGFLR